MSATTIDHTSRKRMAELARHLATGRITNDAFEDERPWSHERELYDIRHWGLWPLYSDLEEHTLAGRHALTPEARRWVARIILFLRSGLPYRWPRITGLQKLPVMLLSLLSLGWYGRYSHRERWRDGDESVWPFHSRAEYEQALTQPVYLRGRHAV